MITIVAIILERDIISIWPGGRERETGEQQTSTATATTKINKQQATNKITQANVDRTADRE